MNYFQTMAFANKLYYENMKTFKDLEFNPHPSGNGIQSRVNFKNGHGLSVVKGHIFIGDNDLYEMAELFNDELVSGTSIMEVTEEQITEKLIELQEL
jgi:hypothetical protein